MKAIVDEFRGLLDQLEWTDERAAEFLGVGIGTLRVTLDYLNVSSRNDTYAHYGIKRWIRSLKEVLSREEQR